MTKKAKRSPSLVSTRFNEMLDAVMYALVIAKYHKIAAERMRTEATRADNPKEAALCTEAAEHFDTVAKHYHLEAANNLETLYGLGPEHLPFIDVYVQKAVDSWAELG